MCRVGVISSSSLSLCFPSHHLWLGVNQRRIVTSKITTKGVDVIDLALAHQNTPTRQARGSIRSYTRTPIKCGSTERLRSNFLVKEIANTHLRSQRSLLLFGCLFRLFEGSNFVVHCINFVPLELSCIVQWLYSGTQAYDYWRLTRLFVSKDAKSNLSRQIWTSECCCFFRRTLSIALRVRKGKANTWF